MTVYINQFYNAIANVPSAFQQVNVVDYIPEIVQSDIANGVITRYFARQANMITLGPITEIDPTLAANINNNPFWKVISMDWRIAGPLNDVTSSVMMMLQPTRLSTGVITSNKISLALAEQQMPGMQYKILNYAQFYTFQASAQGVPPQTGYAPPLDPPATASITISPTASVFFVPTQLPNPLLIVPTQQIRATTGSGVVAAQSFAPQPIYPLPAPLVELIIPSTQSRQMFNPVVLSSSVSTVTVYGNAVVPQVSQMSLSSSIVQVRPSTNANIFVSPFVLTSSISTVFISSQSNNVIRITPIQLVSSISTVSVVGSAIIPTASVQEMSAIGQVSVSTTANTPASTISVSSSIGGVSVQGIANVKVVPVVVSSSIVPVVIGASSASAPASITISPSSLFLTNSIQAALTASVEDQYHNPLVFPVFWTSQFPTYVFVSSSVGIVQGLIGGQVSIITATVSGTNISASVAVTTATPVPTFLQISPISNIIYSGSYGMAAPPSASAEIFTTIEFDQFNNVIPCGVSASVGQTLVVTPSNVILSSSFPFVLTGRVTDQFGNPLNISLNWASSNTASVSVTVSGTLTAYSGSSGATITVSIPNSSISQFVTVTTTAPNPLFVIVSPSSTVQNTFGVKTGETAVTFDQYGQVYP
jgi:hypothetical protein